MLREAIAALILEREVRVCVHWALPPAARLQYIDCEANDAEEAFMQLDRLYLETQFMIGTHVTELVLFLGEHNAQTQVLHDFVKVEEQSRQHAAQIREL